MAYATRELERNYKRAYRKKLKKEGRCINCSKKKESFRMRFTRCYGCAINCGTTHRWMRFVGGCC